MEIIGTQLAVPWDCCIPFYYGEYKGKLKNGKECIIDLDWKIRAYTADTLDQVGTDEILYWLCDVNHVKTLIDAFENTRQ